MAQLIDKIFVKGDLDSAISGYFSPFKTYRINCETIHWLSYFAIDDGNATIISVSYSRAPRIATLKMLRSNGGNLITICTLDGEIPVSKHWLLYRAAIEPEKPLKSPLWYVAKYRDGNCHNKFAANIYYEYNKDDIAEMMQKHALDYEQMHRACESFLIQHTGMTSEDAEDGCLRAFEAACRYKRALNFTSTFWTMVRYEASQYGRVRQGTRKDRDGLYQ